MLVKTSNIQGFLFLGFAIFLVIHGSDFNMTMKKNEFTAMESVTEEVNN